MPDPASPWRRLLCIVSLSFIAVLAVFLTQDIINRQFHQQWHWAYYHFGNDLYKKRLFYGMLPVPFAFALWLRALERNGRFAGRINPFAIALSLCAFACIPLVYLNPWRLEAAFDTGVITGLFAFVPLRLWLRRAAQQKRLALTALLAGSCAWDYYALMGHMASHTVLDWTTRCASALLGALGIENVVSEEMEYKLAFDVVSSHFKIIMAPFCGGLEGIFLFFFLLSMAFLLDWPRFAPRRLWPLYPLGAAAMFFANVLRITGLFALGHWLYAPDAPSWTDNWGDLPIDLFHSYVGWLLDMAIFALLAVWLYRRPVKKTEM